MENPFAKLPNLSPDKMAKLSEYGALLREVNQKVNLLSRKDMDDVEYRHIAFCAAISQFFKPDRGARIADVGTGGGLPGIVLAVLYPDAYVEMFDGVGKKIAMINEMVSALKLSNAYAHNARIEEYRDTFDYVTGRAVCSLPLFFGFVKKRLLRGRKGNLKNGVIYFKGGELEPELVSKKIFPDAELDLQKFFGDERFEGKRIVHFPTESVLKL